MKKVKFKAVSILFLLLFSVSCVKEDFLESEVRKGEDEVNVKIQTAQELFENAVETMAKTMDEKKVKVVSKPTFTKSETGGGENQNDDKRRFVSGGGRYSEEEGQNGEEEFMPPFYVGNIIPLWEKATTNVNKWSGAINVEVPIKTDYTYRVIVRDSLDNPHSIKCYQKLLVCRDTMSGKIGVHLMFYIPTYQYKKTHKFNIADKFGNTGQMEDYSGLVVYST